MGPANGGSLVGRRLGDYHLQSLLGAGGMAEVYRALELPLGREVAVKVLPAGLAADPNYVARFKTEARRVAQLRHPNIVEVYAFNGGDHGNLLYLVMPILTQSLRDLLDEKGRLPITESIRIVTEIASGLDMAHSFGLVHRDVKPENILLDKDGRALLTDFGIAREVPLHRQGTSAQTLAATGLPVGTPEYMSPEQLRGGPVDQRADIYALGSVLYELLTGRVPHEAETPYEVAALVLTEAVMPPSKRNGEISPELEEVVMKALAKIPGQRYTDMRSFALALNVAARSGQATTRNMAGGWQRKTMRIPTWHGPAVSTPAQFAGIPDGPDVARIVDAPTDTVPSIGYRAASKGQLRYRGLVILGIAALVVASLCGGGTLMFLNGNGPFGGSPQVSLSGPAATQTARALAGNLPTATDQATGSPLASPTLQPAVTPPPSPHATATATAIAATIPLTFAPTPLVFTKSGGSCRATQYITNTSSQTVGWGWTSKQPLNSGTFSFTITNSVTKSSRTSAWPPQDMSPGIAPKAYDQLQITVTGCFSSPISVTAVDTLGNRYNFVLQRG